MTLTEGEKAIRDFIEPLSVTLPKTAKLLEARIVHVQPSGREVAVTPVELSDGRTRVELRFKLLNKDEFFFVKLLINGKLNPDDLRFTLSVDDLPPTISPKSRPFRALDDEPTTGIPAIFQGIIPLCVAIATSYGLIALGRGHPELFPGDARFHWFSGSTAAITVWIGGIIYWVVRSMQMIVARGLFGPKRRFHLPPPAPSDDLRRVMFDPEDRLLTREYMYRRHLEPRLSPDERRRLLYDLERQILRQDPDDEKSEH